MSLAEPSAVTVKREAEFLSPSSGPGIIITQRESHALNSASVKGFKRSSVQAFKGLAARPTLAISPQDCTRNDLRWSKIKNFPRKLASYLSCSHGYWSPSQPRG